MIQRAILCPRCRQIIGSEETVCSWCGASRKALWWRIPALFPSEAGSERFFLAIAAANVIYYIISLLMSMNTGGIEGFFSPNQTSLLLLGATGTLPIDRYGNPWSLLSANYLHGGLLHLLFNMIALRQIIPQTIEEYGASRMFTIYTVGGVLGYIVSYFAGVSFTVGASASLCSLIGALLYYGKSRGGVYGNNIYKEVTGWVISLFIFGLIFPGINNWGHGGGIIGGILCGIILGYSEQRRESQFDRILALICMLATVAAIGITLVMLFF